MTLQERIEELVGLPVTYVDETFSWEKPVTREELIQMAGLGGDVLDGISRVEMATLFYAPR